MAVSEQSLCKPHARKPHSHTSCTVLCAFTCTFLLHLVFVCTHCGLYLKVKEIWQLCVNLRTGWIKLQSPLAGKIWPIIRPVDCSRFFVFILVAGLCYLVVLLQLGSRPPSSLSLFVFAAEGTAATCHGGGSIQWKILK